MQVIATVGMPGCGKSEAADVARERGISVVTMGDVVRREARRRGLDATDENLGEVATELREEEGDAAVADRCVEVIRGMDADAVLVDGVRGWSEAKRFQEEWGDDFTLVAIEVPFDLRLERIRERGRSDDFGSEEELRRRDRRELGYGLGEALERADVRVENKGSLEDFRDQFGSLLDEIAHT